MAPQTYQYTSHYAQYSQYSQYAQSTSASQGHSAHSSIEEWKNESSWQTPTAIDDNDLTFDGKPLNLLHEENQSRAWQGGEVSSSFFFPLNKKL